jgi:transposase
MYYVGLDLHKRYVTACVIDKEGTVLARERRLGTSAEVLLSWLAPLGPDVAIALEATLYWAWLHDRLTAAGYQVTVAHAQQVKLICAARCKTDPVDAQKLAELLRMDLLPAIWIPDPETRAQRKLLRGRAWLVRRRTQVKNRVHAYLAEENQRIGVADLFGQAGRDWLATVELPPPVRVQVALLLELVDLLDHQVVRLDRQVRQAVKRSPVARQLESIPGVGPFGALLLAAEMGPLERFPTSHHLVSYAGLVASTRSSGDKTRHGSVGPAGSPWLKWMLIEAVQTLKRRPGPVRDHYERLLRAKGKQKATVAAARKLCCYVYWMLKRGQSYPECLAEYERSREGCPILSLVTVA